MSSKADTAQSSTRRSYGPFVRIAEPDRHIYQTTIDYRRWMFGLGALGGVVLMGWEARNTWRLWTDVFSRLFSIFLGAVAGSLLLITFMLFTYGTRLEINPREIVLLKRGFFGRTRLRTWALVDLETVAVKDMPTFHIGGSTSIYPIALIFADGDEQGLVATFDDVGPAERLTRDIAESVQSMASRSQA